MIGTRLGPYEITAKLGEGGMGEVFRATDTKLRREVALKLLPAAFTEDEERLARFEREAQLLAQLQHPNIAAIFGMEESGGTRALVMELVEGPTLAERLEKGPCSLEESLSIARQIAEALEEAHEKGIVHRDLKPQNIKAAVEGKVKVLDFGLARAMDPGAAASGGPVTASPTLLHSPTLTAAGTQLGVILGTAAYMAPEQAKGFAVDKRADIWAFGVVLFEMLTGRTLFAGDSVADTLARVLQRDVDFGLLPAPTPPAIRRLLRRCLERNPKNRLHDVADARLVIDEVLSGKDRDESGAATEATAARSTRPLHLAWLVALALAVSATAWLTGGTSEPRAAHPEPQHLAIQLPLDQQFAIATNSLLKFTPDGRALLISAVSGGRHALFRRDLGEPVARPIEGTEDGLMAFFSTDGRWLGFVARNQLMKVPVEGGQPIRLGEMRGSGGATWLTDGTIVVAPIYSDGLFRLSGDGGDLVRLTTPDKADGVLGHWWPQELPGGGWVLFTAFRTPVDRSRIGAVELATGEVRWLVEGGFFARYAPTGHLLYARAQRLYAAPFDASELRLTGPAVPVLDDLLVEQTGGNAVFDLSSRGTLAYARESIGHPAHELVWIDRDGRRTPAAPERNRFLSVDLSPDDRRAAVTVQGESRDLWVLSLERGTLSRLTSGADTEFDPTWLAGGGELAYVVDRPPFEIYRIAAGSSDAGRPLWNERAELDTTSPTPSPDGRELVYCLTEEGTGANLYRRPLDGTEPARPFRAGRGEEQYPAFSPDGRFLAYQSDETGRPEVYVEAFPGPGERVQVTADGGREPVWARGGELYYRRGAEIRVVATRTAGGFAFDAPRTLFEVPGLQTPSGVGSRQYDVAADGRLLAIVVPDELRPRQIEVVTDWTAELARRVGRGR